MKVEQENEMGGKEDSRCCRWTPDTEGTEALLQPFPHIEVRSHPYRGRGLFAKRSIVKGKCLLDEAALLVAQNVDNARSGIVACHHCLLSLETVEGVLVRVARRHDLVAQLPQNPTLLPFTPPIVPCDFAAGGCTVYFCSVSCKDAADVSFHRLCCLGRLHGRSWSALQTFASTRWEQGGIDYADTHLVALQAIARALCRHRFDGMSLEAAYAPFSRLAAAPLETFHFRYLLNGDIDPRGEETVAERRSKFLRLLQEQENPREGCSVEGDAVEEGFLLKSELLNRGVELLTAIFRYAEHEAAFFSVSTWSNLLGAILLNGQERAPPSTYAAYHSLLRELRAIEPLKRFHRTLQASQIDVQELNASALGQGVYAIGCLFNHSCAPNVQVVYGIARDERLLAVALRDIAEGEELCISYIDESKQVLVRQQQLLEHYLFRCACDVCVDELSTLDYAECRSS